MSSQCGCDSQAPSGIRLNFIRIAGFVLSAGRRPPLSKLPNEFGVAAVYVKSINIKEEWVYFELGG